jgi:hypothetical protein
LPLSNLIGNYNPKKLIKKSMENIYQQAVLDAKAVRASAMANAKATIQEAFEPKIKAMLKKHIVESEENMEEAEYMEMEEAEYMDTSNMDDMSMEEEMLDETALDEILAELEAMTEMEDEEEVENDLENMEMEEMYDMDETLNEAEEEEEVEEEESEDEESEEEEESEEMEDEESNEETKVVDITLGDLVDAIKAAMGNQPEEMTDMEASEDDSISLDEILAELEDDEMKEEKMKDADHSMEEAKKELEDAKKAIEEMRAELNEVNLLNAKLLYVNKIFKSKSLTESQKVKVLNAFDRATNVKEVKNVYATINESVTAAPKKKIKESYGFASKPTGYSQKTNTVESDPFIARMQKLAGL